MTLISAAPELLLVAEQFVAAMENITWAYDGLPEALASIVEDARDAITKAKGETK